MAPKDIARRSMPRADDFFAQYVFARRPVVLTNLFAGQEIASVATVDEAARLWGDMTLHLQEEYTSAEGAAEPRQPIFMPLREYIAFARANRATRLCCTEYDTPARMLASFQLPPVCRVASAESDEIF